MAVLEYVRSLDRPAVLDLRARWLDVRRIARSLPVYRACLEAGWEDEDLWPETYARALARQNMGSRYDSARAGVGKYLTVLCTGILTNLLAKQRGKARAAETATDPAELDKLSADPVPRGRRAPCGVDEGRESRCGDPDLNEER